MPELKEKRVDLTYSSRGYWVSHSFMSRDTTLGKVMGIVGSGEVDLVYDC